MINAPHTLAEIVRETSIPFVPEKTDAELYRIEEALAALEEEKAEEDEETVKPDVQTYGHDFPHPIGEGIRKSEVPSVEKTDAELYAQPEPELVEPEAADTVPEE